MMHKHFSINAIMLNARFPQLKPLAFQQLQRHLPGSGRESFSPPFCRPELTYTSTKGGSQKNFHKEATQQHTHTHTYMTHAYMTHIMYIMHIMHKKHTKTWHTQNAHGTGALQPSSMDDPALHCHSNCWSLIPFPILHRDETWHFKFNTKMERQKRQKLWIQTIHRKKKKVTKNLICT